MKAVTRNPTPMVQATLFLRPAFSITTLAGGLGVRVTVQQAG